MTAGRIHDEPPMRTGRTQARGIVIVLALCVAVGMLWFSSAAEGNESFRPLTTLTVSLAIIVGLSMAPKRSFVIALALAATAFVGLVLGAIMSGQFDERWSALIVGTYAILLSVLALAAWLVGAAIRHVARRVIVRRMT
jgi:peptidoglycan/LPS O-acetylase OafA/YrhL